MKYHLAHIIPNPRMHGLNGYKDVIDTLQWGLDQLGHEVTYAVNQISGEATNIIFGAQMIPAATLRLLPADTSISIGAIERQYKARLSLCAANVQCLGL
jgi:hypothetical protein